MAEHHKPFARFALDASAEHEHYFRQPQLDKANTEQFHNMAEVSLAKQKEIESKNQLPFDEFLKQYFAQS